MSASPLVTLMNCLRVGVLLLGAGSAAGVALSFDSDVSPYALCLAPTLLGTLWFSTSAPRKLGRVSAAGSYALVGWLTAAWWIAQGVNAMNSSYWWGGIVVLTLVSLWSAVPYGIGAVLCILLESRCPPVARPSLLAACLTLCVEVWPHVFPGSLAPAVALIPELVQIGDFGGEPIIHFFLYATGFYLACGLVARNEFRREALVIAMTLGTAWYCYGMWQVSQKGTTSAEVSFTIGLVQPNLPIEHVVSRGVSGSRADLFSLTQEMLSLSPPPDLIVWPEVPLFFSPKNNPDDQRELGVLLQSSTVPLLLNADMYTNETVYSRVPYYNTVQMLRGSGEVQAEYRKNILIPLGEYLPFEKFISTPDTERFLAGFRRYVHGEAVTVFKIPTKTGDTIVGTPICVEIQHPRLVAEMVRQGAQILVNPANDAYFGDVTASRFGEAFAKLRAVEFGIPVVRVTNSGASGVILPSGKMITGSKIEEFKKGAVVVSVPLGGAGARRGAREFGLVLLCAMVVGCLVVGRARGAKRAG